jgi:hypothetical protein
MKIQRHHVLIFLLLLLFAVDAAAVTTIYKYSLPDGSILYSQSAPPNGKRIGTVQVPALTRSQLEAQRNAPRQLAQDRERFDQLSMARALRNSLQNQACNDAFVLGSRPRRGFFLGLEPLPGERIGTVGRFSRLRESYWRRIFELRQNVELLLDQVDWSRTEFERFR